MEKFYQLVTTNKKDAGTFFLVPATNEDKNSKSVCMQKKKRKLLQLKAIFHVFVDVALIHVYI